MAKGRELRAIQFVGGAKMGRDRFGGRTGWSFLSDGLAASRAILVERRSELVAESLQHREWWIFVGSESIFYRYNRKELHEKEVSLHHRAMGLFAFDNGLGAVQ